MRTVFCLLVILLAVVPAQLQAAESVFDNEYKAWSVFHTTQDGRKVCYVTSSPSAKTGNYKHRGEPYALVTYRGNRAAEVSISAGYPYKKGSTVDVTIDTTKVNLFTTEETPKIAWAKDTATDQLLVKQMKKGKNLVAKANSQLGTHSKDTYSLMGFTKAYNRMVQLCK